MSKKTNKIARARRASAILWSLKKLTSACLFQIAREKSCDYLLIICMENTRWSIIIKHKQSARQVQKIIYSNRAFSQNNCVDQNNNMQ